MTAGERAPGREPFGDHREGWFIGRNDIGDYMHRWIIQTPFGTLRVHHILRSDEARAMHDHPWDFWTLLVSGGYYEVTPHPQGLEVRGLHTDESKPVEVTRWWPRWSLRHVRAEQLHRLILVEPVWTVVVSGPKRRAWGFMTSAGWLHWRDARDQWAGKGYDVPRDGATS